MSDAKTPKPLPLGKFKPLTPDTSLARIAAAALPGKCTVEQIAEKARLRPDQVAHRLRYGLGVAHGIGYQKAENGVILQSLQSRLSSPRPQPNRQASAPRHNPVLREGRRVFTSPLGVVRHPASRARGI